MPIVIPGTDTFLSASARNPYRLPVGIVIGIRPESLSPSSRNRYRHRAEYAVTKTFYERTDYASELIDAILKRIARDPQATTVHDLANAVDEWRENPFNPHLVARSRTVAFQKAVLMKYIKNLVDWGDSLFRQDTMESLVQATQMYVLAEKLLGPKPRIVPPPVQPVPESYNQIEAKVDVFGNALMDLEDMISDVDALPHGGLELPPSPVSLYFCVPPNDKMRDLWDLVSDRLFKIRHCQNIDGVERILALFAPPIDPGALVRATAAGLDLSDIVGGLNAPPPIYRFQTLSAKATELAQIVSSLGNALLQAIEKRDAEKLSQIRSEQEIRVLNATRAVREQQIREAEENLNGVLRSREVVEERQKFYSSRKYMNAWEISSAALSVISTALETAISLGHTLSSVLTLIPDVTTGASGFGGSPVATFELPSGDKTAKSAEAVTRTLSAIAHAADKTAGMLSTQASYWRRKEDWDFQALLAEKELQQIFRQIVASQIRLEISRKELSNHELQIENAKKTDEYLRTKFSNQELYDWMSGQISSVYFQAYQLALQVAKKAERAFGHELATTPSFLSAGYWDNLKRGLMTADRLLHDIKRMEVAYLEQNKREYELTKHISMALLNPEQLETLKATGSCTFNVLERDFDLDRPGDYLRRIKWVSLTIPCVTGPYVSVHCKLTLVSNKYRKETSLIPEYPEQLDGETRFVYNVGAIQSIVTSQGQNDSGLFELSTQDPRYLPFEGTGAISTWKLELVKPGDFPQFDYRTISDVILHMRYTARDGGPELQDDAITALRNSLQNQPHYQLLSLRQHFPSEWHMLTNSGSAQIKIQSEHLPFFARQSSNVEVGSFVWMASKPVDLKVGKSEKFSLAGTPIAKAGMSQEPLLIAPGIEFSLGLSDKTLEDLLLLFEYKIQ